MKLTNKKNLPEAFVRAVSEDDGKHQFDEFRFSCTELLGSIKQIMLGRKYREEIEQDVSDLMPAMIGTAVHSFLEKFGDNDALIEQKLEAKFGKFTLVGYADVIKLLEQLIEDYKTCSVSKVMREDFEDWKHQGLEYAYLAYIIFGVIIKKLKFIALMKDWSKLKAANNPSYPQSPVYVWEYNIADSDYDYILDFIKNKFKAIEQAMITKELPDCSESDTWYTGDKYAVYKKAGDKAAARVLDSEQEAHDYITNKCGGAGEIQVRKGENLNCKYYCSCKKFCKQGGSE